MAIINNINQLSIISNQFKRGALHLSRELYKSTLILTNKPNFHNAKMMITLYFTRGYERIQPMDNCQNKPNSKPIQTQSKPIKANQTQFENRASNHENQESRIQYPASRIKNRVSRIKQREKSNPIRKSLPP